MFRITVFAIAFLALFTCSKATNITETTRSAETCADPSLAHKVYQAFRADWVAHLLTFRWSWQDQNTRLGAAAYIDQHAAFLAWPTQQPFTVPLFQLGTPDLQEFIYQIGADAETPPIVSGFNNFGVIAWVYNTQVCGSVPLMTAFFSLTTDHYFTTSTFEHDGLLSSGWTPGQWVDTGVIAYVLPLTDD